MKTAVIPLWLLQTEAGDVSREAKWVYLALSTYDSGRPFVIDVESIVSVIDHLSGMSPDDLGAMLTELETVGAVDHRPDDQVPGQFIVRPSLYRRPE